MAIVITYSTITLNVFVHLLSFFLIIRKIYTYTNLYMYTICLEPALIMFILTLQFRETETQIQTTEAQLLHNSDLFSKMNKVDGMVT